MYSAIDGKQQKKNNIGFYLLFSFSSNNVPAEEDQVAGVFGEEPNSEMTLQDTSRRQVLRRPQCRFAGCGK